MPLTLNNVYPWGRTLAEYANMFALTGTELATKRILSAADGPASFNAELTRQRQGGAPVTSVDPLYAFTGDEIRARVTATADAMTALVTREAHRFVWRHVRSPEDLRELRLRAMETFLVDYDTGRATGRYVAESLPHLDFPDGHFDLAVCSHFLFLYSADFDAAFHIAALRELLRLAAEARVFPLLDLTGQPSSHLPQVVKTLQQDGFTVTIDPVPYEFQRGGDHMLRLRRR